MSANIQIIQMYGDDQSPTEEVQASLPLSGQDTSTTDSLLQNPIYVNQSANQFSYERKFKIKVLDMVDVQEVKEFKVYQPEQSNLEENGDGSDNINFMFGSEVQYSTPVDTESQIQTSTIPYSLPATQNLPIGGALDQSLLQQDDETDIAVLQLKVFPTQSSSDSVSIIINYREIF